MRITLLPLVATVVLSLPYTTSVSGQQPAPRDRLGVVRFVTSCPPAAQERLDRAVALLHHMTYPAAGEAFAAIAAEFPTCAMAHWGIAMTLFQPLWPTRPSEEDLRRGWEEVLKAQQVDGTTERERMFIAAAAAFFEPGVPDYWTRIGQWADAMAALHTAYPDDPEAAAIHALAQLATAPPSGDTSHHEAAAAVLASILREHPTHPGAVHYTIHANDANGRERESLDVVESYDAIAPRNAHALHMPTHIFVRLGDWKGVIEGNTRAAEAALANPAGDRGQWVWDEYPHAIEYLVYAHLQTGDDSAALRAWTELEGTANLQPTFKTAFHLSSIPARYALERRAWADAARLEARRPPGLNWDLFPWPEAVTWFARGIGAARSGSAEGARAAESRLAELREAAARSGEDLFTRQTEVLRLGVAAWLAHVEGDSADAVELMRQAVALEASTPKHAVTPAPTLPAAELLGDLLLELNRPAVALAAYRASLEAAPNRFNSIAGAARAAALAGDSSTAAAYDRRLRALASPGSPRAELGAAERRASGAFDAASGVARADSGSPDREPRVIPLRKMAGDVQILYGDPERAGEAFVMRIRELPGSRIPLHSHPVDEHITVVEGTWYFAVGDRWEESALEELKPGTYAFAPKGSLMYGASPNGAVVQVHGVGPFHIHWRDGLRTLDDADAPAIFRFRRGELVQSPRGNGTIVQGYASGAIVQYEIEGADGRFMADEADVRRLPDAVAR